MHKECHDMCEYSGTPLIYSFAFWFMCMYNMKIPLSKDVKTLEKCIYAIRIICAYELPEEIVCFYLVMKVSEHK